MFILKKRPCAFELFYEMKYALLLAHGTRSGRLTTRDESKKTQSKSTAVAAVQPKKSFLSKQSNAKRSQLASNQPKILSLHNFVHRRTLGIHINTLYFMRRCYACNATQFS